MENNQNLNSLWEVFYHLARIQNEYQIPRSVFDKEPFVTRLLTYGKFSFSWNKSEHSKLLKLKKEFECVGLIADIVETEHSYNFEVAMPQPESYKILFERNK